MATYFIFPKKDATIYENPLKTSINTGMDEIIEITKELYSGNYYNSRILIQFDTNELINIINNKISGSQYTASLELLSTEHQELGFEQTLDVYPLSESWQNGLGKYSNTPSTNDGVSWLYRESSSLWNQPGGSYFTGSEYSSSQTFSYSSDLDTFIDVTKQVELWYYGSAPNNGLIIKRSDNQESGSISYGSLKYFSKETHTIYPSRIKFEWDDSSYNTGSLSVLNSGSFVIQLKDTPQTLIYRNSQRYRLYVRPKYPTRTFQTSSLVSTNYALPSSSYYSIVDYKTGDILIQFNENSKLSCDSLGMFFDLDTNGYQPERYYKIVLKVINDEGTKIIDNDLIFKLIR
jgi:hypothetical protein